MIKFSTIQQQRDTGTLFRILCPVGKVLPFQFVVPSTQTEITKVYLVSCDGQQDITSAMTSGGITVLQKGTYNIVKYPAKQNVSDKQGTYYIKMIISGVTYYSEAFTMTTDQLLKIEFGNDINLMMGDTEINFESFNFEYYAFAILSKPEYTYEEEATQRGGYTFIESQISKKTYKSTFLATENICDRLRLIRLCTDKTITYKDKVYNALTFDFSPEWREEDELASVNIEFDVDDVIARSGGYQDTELFKRDFDNSYNQSYS